MSTYTRVLICPRKKADLNVRIRSAFVDSWDILTSVCIQSDETRLSNKPPVSGGEERVLNCPKMSSTSGRGGKGNWTLRRSHCFAVIEDLCMSREWQGADPNKFYLIDEDVRRIWLTDSLIDWHFSPLWHRLNESTAVPPTKCGVLNAYITPSWDSIQLARSSHSIPVLTYLPKAGASRLKLTDAGVSPRSMRIELLLV